MRYQDDPDDRELARQARNERKQARQRKREARRAERKRRDMSDWIMSNIDLSWSK